MRGALAKRGTRHFLAELTLFSTLVQPASVLLRIIQPFKLDLARLVALWLAPLHAWLSSSLMLFLLLLLYCKLLGERHPAYDKLP